jgi:hypothetical protein
VLAVLDPGQGWRADPGQPGDHLLRLAPSLADPPYPLADRPRFLSVHTHNGTSAPTNPDEVPTEPDQPGPDVHADLKGVSDKVMYLVGNAAALYVVTTRDAQRGPTRRCRTSVAIRWMEEQRDEWVS